MRPIDADKFKETLRSAKIQTVLDAYAIERINGAPTIKTKTIKYYDDDENVWKVGEVIVDE